MGEPWEVVSARPVGASWLLDGLRRKLGMAEGIASAVDDRRFRTDVERVLFALVASREIPPHRSWPQPSGARMMRPPLPRSFTAAAG